MRTREQLARLTDEDLATAPITLAEIDQHYRSGYLDGFDVGVGFLPEPLGDLLPAALGDQLAVWEEAGWTGNFLAPPAEDPPPPEERPTS